MANIKLLIEQAQRNYDTRFQADCYFNIYDYFPFTDNLNVIYLRGTPTSFKAQLSLKANDDAEVEAIIKKYCEYNNETLRISNKR